MRSETCDVAAKSVVPRSDRGTDDESVVARKSVALKNEEEKKAKSRNSEIFTEETLWK